MAKNKTKKEDKKQEFPYAKEIQGLFLILMGVLGFGKFGPVGRVIRNFAVFRSEERRVGKECYS